MTRGSSARESARVRSSSAGEVAATEQRLAGVDHRLHRLLPVHERRELGREGPLGLAGRGPLLDRDRERLDLGAIAEAEDLQVAHDVAIIGVEPELVEGVGRGHRPGRATPTPEAVLPNFVPSALVISGVANACAETPSTRWMRSSPAVRLPHWSLPPVCSRQP